MLRSFTGLNLYDLFILTIDYSKNFTTRLLLTIGYMSMFVVKSKLCYVLSIVVIEYDECATKQHGCDHECVNTLGSFKCECRIGYELHSDGKKCEGTDISLYHFSCVLMFYF